MVYRIEIAPVSESLDAKGQSVKKLIKDFFDIDIDKVITRDVYTVSADISDSDAEKILTVGDAIKFIESKAA